MNAKEPNEGSDDLPVVGMKNRAILNALWKPARRLGGADPPRSAAGPPWPASERETDDARLPIPCRFSWPKIEAFVLLSLIPPAGKVTLFCHFRYKRRFIQ